MSIPTPGKEPFKTKDDKMTTGSEKCLKFALKLESPGFFANSHWIWTCHWRRWILVMSGTPVMPQLSFQAWSKELNKQLLSEGQVPPQVGKEIASASFLKPLSDVSVPQFFHPEYQSLWLTALNIPVSCTVKAICRWKQIYSNFHQQHFSRFVGLEYEYSLFPWGQQQKGV